MNSSQCMHKHTQRLSLLSRSMILSCELEQLPKEYEMRPAKILNGTENNLLLNFMYAIFN